MSTATNPVNIDPWCRSAKAEALADLVNLLVQDHHQGRMPAAEYRIHLQRLMQEAEHYGVTDQVRRIVMQAAPEEPLSEAEKLDKLERLWREKDAEYRALLKEHEESSTRLLKLKLDLANVAFALDSLRAKR